MEDLPAALRAPANAINRTIQSFRRNATIRRTTSPRRVSAHFQTTFNPLASPHRARYYQWKTAARDGRKERLEAWATKRSDFIPIINDLRRQINDAERALRSHRDEMETDLWDEIQRIHFRDEKNGNPRMREGAAEHRAMSMPCHRKNLQEKKKLEEEVGELHKSLDEAFYQMKIARGSFEVTEKEIMLQIATEALGFLSSEKTDEKREWAIEVSKQHWQRLSQVQMPISHSIPISMYATLKFCATNWGHLAGGFEGEVEGGYWCGFCGKRTARPSTCKKCEMRMCHGCTDDLKLLRRYDEWLEDETDRLFGADKDA